MKYYIRRWYKWYQYCWVFTHKDGYRRTAWVDDYSGVFSISFAERVVAAVRHSHYRSYTFIQIRKRRDLSVFSDEFLHKVWHDSPPDVLWIAGDISWSECVEKAKRRVSSPAFNRISTV